MAHVPSAAPSSRLTDPAIAAIGAFDAGREPVAGSAESGWCPPDAEAVLEFLARLGKAVRHFQTLPARSPICIEAITAAHTALVGLTDREHLAFRVGPSWLMIDDVFTIDDAGGALDLARRLHRVQVAAVEITRTATPDELARFCAELGTFREATRSADGFVQSWTGQRIDRITVRASHRPVVIEAGTPHAVARQLVDYAQRQRQEQLAAGGPVHHLYPPARGWVRVDPSVRYEAASLVDLALLLEDPVELATAMTRLADDSQADAIDPENAFAERFAELSALFAGLDPQVGELLFDKLARSLLDLDEPRRLALLRQTVLPGLLDGRLEGSVLASFPDLALADALCLLLDLETAAPEVLATAMDRLALPTERREALAPLIRDGLERRRTVGAGGQGLDVTFDRFVQRLVSLDPAVPRHFGDFVAFDLAVTDKTREDARRIALEIETTDAIDARLGTACALVRLDPDPAVAARSLDQIASLLDAVVGQGRWRTVADVAHRLRALASTLEATRPAVAEAVAAVLRVFWTPERLAPLATGVEHDGLTPSDADALIDAFGIDLTTAIVAGLDDPVTADRALALLPLLNDRAAAVAPLLVPQLASATGAGRLAVIRLLGRAGTAFGGALAALLANGDAPTVREVLSTLAGMGSAAAAATVAEHIEAGPDATRAAAVEALLRFPPERTLPRIRALLANGTFVRQNPGLTLQLLEHVSGQDAADFAPALRALTALRFRIWNPALVRVAHEATRLLDASR